MLHKNSADIHKGAYVQSSDPGAVGAKILWIDTTTSPAILKRRADDNGSWVTLTLVSVLSGLSDASVSTPQDGDLLVYRSSDSKWHNYQPYATGTVHWEPCSDSGGNLLVDNTGAVVMALMANTG